ncbi:MAG: DUF2868 domain-containing protein [Betaproteobacteria bacterium]|nr:DUF2868 domain-containing protein [Betaproteobacteria bacterium]
MHEEALRSVLLIKAIEESDRAGTLVPAAERLAASREARRSAGAPAPGGDREPASAALPGAAQRLLALRAGILERQVVARHPFVGTALAAAAGPAWVGLLLIVAGLLGGLLLSALDGTQRINILAPGLVLLVLWNVVIYLMVAARWIRSWTAGRARRPWLADLIARNGLTRLARLTVKSAAFDGQLATALRRFAVEWLEAARPLLLARATRVFHLCAAAAGAGLIAGLYLRGIVLDYQAGWGSTFLDPPQVRTLLAAMYGPASLATGIAVPDPTHIQAIRWLDGTGGAGGARAALWIHLLAATAALFIVLPRLLLALLGSVFITRWSRRAPLPPALSAYYRAAFGGVDGAIGRGIIMVAPYAYEPAAAALARLRALLPPALGETLSVDSRATVAYGGEDAFLEHLGERGGSIADVIVLLFNLAATPEEENHGAILAGLRRWLEAQRRHAQLLVLVDEGPYAARMTAQGGPGERLAARRAAWRNFVAAHGLQACFVDLAAAAPQPVRGEPADGAVIGQLRGALWQPAGA